LLFLLISTADTYCKLCISWVIKTISIQQETFWRAVLEPEGGLSAPPGQEQATPTVGTVLSPYFSSRFNVAGLAGTKGLAKKPTTTVNYCRQLFAIHSNFPQGPYQIIQSFESPRKRSVHVPIVGGTHGQEEPWQALSVLEHVLEEKSLEGPRGHSAFRSPHTLAFDYS